VRKREDKEGTFKIAGWENGCLVEKPCDCGKVETMDCTALIEKGIYKGFSEIRNPIGLQRIILNAKRKPSPKAALFLLGLLFNTQKLPHSIKIDKFEVSTGKYIFYFLLTLPIDFWGKSFLKNLPKLKIEELLEENMAYLFDVLPYFNSEKVNNCLEKWKNEFKNRIKEEKKRCVSSEERFLYAIFGGHSLLKDKHYYDLVNEALSVLSKKKGNIRKIGEKYLREYLNEICQENEKRRADEEKESTILPCPYCGKPLKTKLAKMCFHCGLDWHDPKNVYNFMKEKKKQ
jgi:hypothetical protein